MILNWKSILKKAGIICLSTILFALCSVLIYITKITGRMHTVNDDIPATLAAHNPNLDEQTQEVLGEYWTIAIFGVDSRDKSVGKGNNADVQMLCSINRTTGDIRLVSVYRDTYLMNDLPSSDRYGKISTSYLEQGPVGNVTALNTNLDIRIDDYISFNWNAAADAINLLGGVDIELSKAEFYYINSFITETVERTGIPSSHLSGAGMQHLDGVQAAAYMRLRNMDTDFARTERQRKVIRQIFEKARGMDFGTLLRVLDTVFCQTLSSLTVEDAADMVRNIKNYHLSETSGFPSSYTAASMGRSGDCVIPNTLESNVEALHRFLYADGSYACSEQVKEISREIIKRAVKN